MKLVSIRIITDNVAEVAEFYGTITGIAPVFLNEVFAEISTPAATLAIGATATVPMFAPGSAEPAANRSAIIEFLVEDVDAEYARLRDLDITFVNEPTTMPWGNRSLLLRDPDGTLVNLFTPVTPAAKEKFGV